MGTTMRQQDGPPPVSDLGTRNTARTSEGRRRRLMVLMGLALVAVVLRSPLSVLTVLGAPESDARPVAGSDPLHFPEPSDAVIATVPRGASTAATDGREPSRTPIGLDAPDVMVEEFRGGWRVEAGAEEAAALAVITAHAWADARSAPPSATEFAVGTDVGAGPSTGVRMNGSGAIVAIEAVERPGALYAVVTLLVAIGPDTHRIAVPVSFGPDGPAVAGPPWPLPAPSATARTLTGTPIGDPELIDAARRALEMVGIPGGRLVSLEATDGWPFIARLDDATEGHPWLRWHLDRFVVSGLPLRPGGGPR